MNNKNVVEHIWMTKSGLAAVVIMTTLGHRCGYVAVRPGHSLHGVGYSEETYALKASNGTVPGSPEMVFDVHGGITFSGVLKHPLVVEKLGKYNPWWFGYDCAHAGDAASPEYYAGMREKYPDSPFMWEPVMGGIHRDLAFCMAECESLASQIRAQAAPRWLAWLRRVWDAIKTRP